MEIEATTTDAIAGPRVEKYFTRKVVAVLLGCIFAFTAAFSLLERWSLVDALYFTTTTLATCGFGDLRPATYAGRALTSACGIVGVGLLGGLTSAVISAWFDTTRGGDADSARPAGAKAAAAQVVALLGVGLVGVKIFDACTWSRALTLVTDVLVTAGLGDVIPTTKACRLFVSLYAPLAVVTFARVIGTLALRPLETARRRAQRRVLDRYGGTLTASKLKEVVGGDVKRRLGLNTSDDYCTRDEFILLTLVLQGKLSEEDIEECRATFRELDLSGDGTLSALDFELAVQQRVERLQERPGSAGKLRRLRAKRVGALLGKLLRPQRFEGAINPEWAEGRGESGDG